MHGRLYSIRKGLTLTRKKEVALRIFMEVSPGFEATQGSWPYSWVTDSGFSAEDLTSNLIGFYRAVEKYSWEQILQACRPTSKETAFAVSRSLRHPPLRRPSPADACPPAPTGWCQSGGAPERAPRQNHSGTATPAGHYPI